jgi:adenylosuccinate synthase
MPARTPINQLARYHRETLLDQIAALHEQIEVNLENKQGIRHLKDLIAERQQYLSQLDETPATPVSRKGLPKGANRQNEYKA